MAWDDMVLVGRIARTHGHRGQVIVDPETDFPRSGLRPGAVLHTMRDGRPGTVTIAAMRMHKGRPVVTFEGSTRWTTPRRWRGVELRVPEIGAAPLPDGTFYEHELVGCTLVTTGGREVGHGAHAWRAAAGDPADRGRGARGVLVPLVADDLRRRSTSRGKRIVIDPPEGLLEVNE